MLSVFLSMGFYSTIESNDPHMSAPPMCRDATAVSLSFGDLRCTSEPPLTFAVQAKKEVTAPNSSFVQNAATNSSRGSTTWVVQQGKALLAKPPSASVKSPPPRSLNGQPRAPHPPMIIAIAGRRRYDGK